MLDEAPKSPKALERFPQVVLVFDAMGGGSRTNVRTTNAGEIDVVYCGEEEADSWILCEVRRVLEFRSRLSIVNPRTSVRRRTAGSLARCGTWWTVSPGAASQSDSTMRSCLAFESSGASTSNSKSLER